MHEVDGKIKTYGVHGVIQLHHLAQEGGVGNVEKMAGGVKEQFKVQAIPCGGEWVQPTGQNHLQ